MQRKSWPIVEKSQDRLSRIILPLWWPLLLSPIYAPCKRVPLQCRTRVVPLCNWGGDKASVWGIKHRDIFWQNRRRKNGYWRFWEAKYSIRTRRIFLFMRLEWEQIKRRGLIGNQEGFPDGWTVLNELYWGILAWVWCTRKGGLKTEEWLSQFLSLTDWCNFLPRGG